MFIKIKTTYFYSKHFPFCSKTYQKYCEGMKNLALVVMEILAISLGVDRLHYKKFFQDGRSIMRCNYYPPCPEPGLTFGTGPHCDSTSLTILHQDEVGGLEIFANNKWQIVRPRHDALVINIGETFTVGFHTFHGIILDFHQLVFFFLY